MASLSAFYVLDAALLVLFTPIEWGIIIVCAIIVLAILAWLIWKYGHWGATDTPPPGVSEILALQSLIAAAKESESMSADDCERARGLIRDARAAGVTTSDLDRLENEINDLCD